MGHLNRGLDGNRVMIDTDKGIAFKPKFDRVLVKPKKTREKTDGGIYIPDEAKIEETMGEVVAVGRGTFDQDGQLIDRDPLFKVGDIVVFKEYTGVHVSLPCDGEYVQFLIMWDRDIIGTLERVDE